MEIWKIIPGYGGLYEASSLGRIRSKARVVTKLHFSGSLMQQSYEATILEGSTDKRGYVKHHLSVNGIKISVKAHRLVLEAFKGKCPDGMEACHNNGKCAENYPGNLRWDTHYNNNQDRKLHGKYLNGSAHHMAKVTPKVVKLIRKSKETGASLAKKYKLGQSQISRIKRGISWKYI